VLGAWPYWKFALSKYCRPGNKSLGLLPIQAMQQIEYLSPSNMAKLDLTQSRHKSVKNAIKAASFPWYSDVP
jgi:hypothetical protein